MKPNKDRNAKILKLRGKKSMGLIAREFGISRGAVAGVFFRNDYPPEHRVSSPGTKSPNKIGEGHHGHGRYARECLPGRNQYGVFT